MYYIIKLRVLLDYIIFKHKSGYKLYNIIFKISDKIYIFKDIDEFINFYNLHIKDFLKNFNESDVVDEKDINVIDIMFMYNNRILKYNKIELEKLFNIIEKKIIINELFYVGEFNEKYISMNYVVNDLFYDIIKFLKRDVYEGIDKRYYT